MSSRFQPFRFRFNLNSVLKELRQCGGGGGKKRTSLSKLRLASCFCWSLVLIKSTGHHAMYIICDDLTRPALKIVVFHVIH